MARWRGPSRDWFERKVADYQLQKRKRMRNVRSPVRKLPKFTESGIRIIRTPADWNKPNRGARKASAKRSASKAAVYGGHALKGAGRLGSRAIPFVGWALFAHDVYVFGRWLSDQRTTALAPSSYSLGFTMWSDPSSPPHIVGYPFDEIHYSRMV